MYENPKGYDENSDLENTYLRPTRCIENSDPIILLICDKKLAHEAVTELFLPHFVICHWTDSQQHAIYLFYITKRQSYQMLRVERVPSPSRFWQTWKENHSMYQSILKPPIPPPPPSKSRGIRLFWKILVAFHDHRYVATLDGQMPHLIELQRGSNRLFNCTYSVANNWLLVWITALFNNMRTLKFKSQSTNIFCNASLMTMEYVQIRVNCRSTLGMFAGMMNP